jgi:hypothetical protein
LNFALADMCRSPAASRIPIRTQGAGLPWKLKISDQCPRLELAALTIASPEPVVAVPSPKIRLGAVRFE